MADPGNSTRSNPNEAVNHNLLDCGARKLRKLLVALAQEPDDYDAGMRKDRFEARPYLNLIRHSLYCMWLHFVVLCIDAGRRDGLHLRQGARDKAIHLNSRTKIAGKTAINTE